MTSRASRTLRFTVTHALLASSAILAAGGCHGDDATLDWRDGTSTGESTTWGEVGSATVIINPGPVTTSTGTSTDDSTTTDDGSPPVDEDMDVRAPDALPIVNPAPVDVRR